MPRASQAAALFSDAEKRLIRRKLAAWFRRHARDLPWRRTRDAYQVWISEVMLQQTQVATVVPYFERFVTRWPDAAALAAADEHQVLHAWEGLGYYRRARQLHAAAKVIVAEHGGEFPPDANAARALPGIGRYTAGAVLSIAFDERLPILEANSVRVLSRLAAVRGDVSRGEAQRRLWSLAEELLPDSSVGQFNQALMELGSEVCTARSPRCDDCPVAAVCAARIQGAVDEIPAPKAKTRYEDVHEAAVVVRKSRRVLVRRRQTGERWAGLWDFPRFEVEARDGSRLDAELADKVRELTGLRVEPTRRLATIKHGVTRFRITLLCHEARCTGGRLRRSAGEIRWLAPADLSQFPLSTTGRKIARLLLAASLPGA